jgi:antitoxin (DNA-binding transcriptional repressor) of toxin-antitoxin stability system
MNVQITSEGGDMRERDTMTQIFNVTEARKHWSELLNTVFRNRTRVIVEKSGIPVAAIVSPQDLEHLKQYEAEEARAWAVVDTIRTRNADRDPDQVLREVTEEVEAVRQEGYEQHRVS